MNKQDINKDRLKRIEFPILGIDYGRKRIGIAVSDSRGIVASPLKHISVSPKTGLKGSIELIKIIIEEWRVKTILLGYPQLFKEKHKDIREEIDEFAELLKGNLDIPILYHDESFSTKQAERIVREGGSNIKAAKGKIDSIASAVMLQEFLNYIKNK
jgi:putative Holliday junction resolvase